MNSWTKESLINKILLTDDNFHCTEGYFKKAEEVIDPIIKEYEEEIKSAIIGKIHDSFHLMEDWLESLERTVRNELSIEEQKIYIKGYNDAANKLNRMVDTYEHYLSDIIDRVFKDHISEK
ncbi:hypothetical protein Barb4_01190 [Bacteroidales bacterium Barb4]|nr:hypothetical protein Barb4_01190 [Bacteroidales bacterium Barb4]